MKAFKIRGNFGKAATPKKNITQKILLFNAFA
jgi:hypothetical protein